MIFISSNNMVGKSPKIGLIRLKLIILTLVKVMGKSIRILTVFVVVLVVCGMGYFGYKKLFKIDRDGVGERLTKNLNAPAAITETTQDMEKRGVRTPKNTHQSYERGSKNVETVSTEPPPGIESKIVFEGRNASMLKEYFGYKEKVLLKAFNDYKIIVRDFDGHKTYDLEGLRKDTNEWCMIYPKWAFDNHNK